jgi:hypothetical protein
MPVVILALAVLDLAVFGPGYFGPGCFGIHVMDLDYNEDLLKNQKRFNDHMNVSD